MARAPQVHMILEPDDLLKAWWLNMNSSDKDLVRTHVGYLPSLMEMKPWPNLVRVLVTFWDNSRMVFRFGDVELTPTIEEVLTSYESVPMCVERKKKPDDNILVPDFWGKDRIKEAFLLDDDEWLGKLEDGFIPFRSLYYRFGQITGFKHFRKEFRSEKDWKERRAFAFVVSLLGTLVFPQKKEHTIHPTVVMVTHALFYGMDYGSSTQYFSLAPIIVADLYRAIGRCQNGAKFFRGCNLLLQWWMVKHLVKSDTPWHVDRHSRFDQFSSHARCLRDNNYRVSDTESFWFKQLGGLKDEDVQWSLPESQATTHIIRGDKKPFLVLAGIRGTRPYAPLRVLRQFGMMQVIPQVDDMSQFMTDNGKKEIPLKWSIIKEWKAKRKAKEYVQNRFQPEVSELYKEWLKRDLAETLVPGPNVPHRVVDVDSEYQIRLHQFQQKYQESEVAHLRRRMEDALTIRRLQNELKDARDCLVGLDDRLEKQILVVESMGHDERAFLARAHLVEDRHYIWSEVDKARRAGFEEGSSSGTR